jgi:predicted nuclease with TOPRIM domain
VKDVSVRCCGSPNCRLKCSREGRLDMNQTNDVMSQQRIAELEAENARLRRTLEMVKAERKELRERVYGTFPVENWPTEEEMIEIVKNLVPGEGMKFFAEMGLLPGKTS